jgi:uncharacterized protein involved in response to NO
MRLGPSDDDQDDGDRRDERPRSPSLNEPSRWRREPFRIFFPLGVLLGGLGVGHWLLYTVGLTEGYSCLGHGLAQVEGFLPAFALGFLLTALPRRTQSAPPSAMMLFSSALGVTVAAAAAVTGHEALAQLAFIAVVVLLVAFAARRFAASGSGGRRPPASFVLLPIGLLHGLAGATLVLIARSWGHGLGRLLVEQGLFSCLVVGVAGLLVPLMSGAPPPPDLDRSPRERWRALGWALLGAGIFASLILEQAGWERLGPLGRAALVAWGLGWRMPQRLLAGPGTNRRLMWLALRLTPLGIALSGLLPDYRVPALHVTFIGGFGLMAFAVASHVTYGHLGLEARRDGSPPAVVLAGSGIALALLARVTADWSATYFAHVGAAAVAWLAGTGAWLLLLGPSLLGSDRDESG